MNAMTHRIILVVAGLAMGTALYVVAVTGIRHTVTFTVTLHDRVFTDAELATIREAARTAFCLKDKQDVSALEGKPARFAVKLSDVTRDDLMWMLSQQLSNGMSPFHYGGPEDPDKNIAIRCVPYLPLRTLVLMTLGLAALFSLGWSFAQVGRRSDRQGDQGRPQPPPGH